MEIELKLAEYAFQYYWHSSFLKKKIINKSEKPETM